jgi:hypothetical protein
MKNFHGMFLELSAVSYQLSDVTGQEEILS